MKTGTLKELNVKPGDVVAWPGMDRYTIKRRDGEMWAWNSNGYWSFDVANSRETYVIISRAAPDPLPHGHVTLPDGRTVDLTANRVRCDLMDPDELQAMKDHGGPYEIWGGGGWQSIEHPSWPNHVTYRVAPNPVVETVVLHGNLQDMRFTKTMCYDDTHSIALTIQDGKIIDTKTEEL